MGSISRTVRCGLLATVCAVVGLGMSAIHSRARAQGFEQNDLFARTASQKLARAFSSPDISYLLYDRRSDRFLASRWLESDRPIPIGSLAKPFTALAYAEMHGFDFPEHTCSGGTSCWLPKGHGRLDITHAVALSCNAYFSELAAATGGAQVTSVAQRFGLHGPGANASPEAMAGRFGVWRESPAALVRAYSLLLGRRSQPGIRDIADGMALSAKDGTAAGISGRHLHRAFLAKTGTAPCTHKEHAPGDGFVLVAWPADVPAYILLVRQHGAPGAHASVLAGRMLRELEP